MDASEKVREGRLRRALDRRGFTLRRSPRRDPGALDYGVYTITNASGADVFSGKGLDGVEKWISDYDNLPEGSRLFGQELVGWAGVDSGRLMLADPAYTRYGSENMSDDDALLDRGVSGWAPHGQCIAVTVLTQNGDGLFPVSVTRDDQNRITSVLVDFTQEAREEAHRQEGGS